jgi:LysM repeat protein
MEFAKLHLRKISESMRIAFIIAFVFTLFSSVQAQSSAAREAYINKYKDVAIRNMREFKIPASITLAQGCLESGNGQSELARKSNNHFGIKCHSSWTGKKTYHDDDKKKECFRVYDHVYDSYADHSRFLQKSRYEKCFQLKITDYKGWAHELKKAGYATNPKYPQLLIKIIEENELWRIDEEVLKGKPSVTKGNSKPKENKPSKVEGSTGSYDAGVIDMYGSYEVRKSKNNIKFITAKGGESVEEVARSLELGPWQIKTYNNIDNGHKFAQGDKIYLQPKRSKAQVEFHIVKEGETISAISQEYGIKESAIYKKNRIPKGTKLTAGQKLWLKKKKPKQ